MQPSVVRELGSKMDATCSAWNTAGCLQALPQVGQLHEVLNIPQMHLNGSVSDNVTCPVDTAEVKSAAATDLPSVTDSLYFPLPYQQATENHHAMNLAMKIAPGAVSYTTDVYHGSATHQRETIPQHIASAKNYMFRRIRPRQGPFEQRRSHNPETPGQYDHSDRINQLLLCTTLLSPASSSAER